MLLLWLPYVGIEKRTNTLSRVPWLAIRDRSFTIASENFLDAERVLMAGREVLRRCEGDQRLSCPCLLKTRQHSTARSGYGRRWHDCQQHQAAAVGSASISALANRRYDVQVLSHKIRLAQKHHGPTEIQRHCFADTGWISANHR